jgi:hypothetical protein
LQQFDVLHRFEDQLLINREQLAALVNIHGPGSSVTLTVVRNGVSIQNETVLQTNIAAANAVGFDAFHYFHGQSGRRELQQCALCHIGGSNSVPKPGEIDNYKFFHGESGGPTLQDCSACHARDVHPLKLPEL